MYLTQTTAMEWALNHMNEAQTNWISRRNWQISFLKPHVYNMLSDSPINYQFCVEVEVNPNRELSFVQLLFADSYIEIIE